MSRVFFAVFLAFSLSLAPVAFAPGALAQQGCSCKGCGCKGGPGWRGPEGTCVAKAKLAAICGSPAGTPCTREAVAQVCATKEAGSAAPKTETEAP